MKRILSTTALFLMCTAGTAFAGTDIGISLNISGEVAPGVYGQVHLGDVHPHMVYENPVIIRPAMVVREPLYLHVPPEHVRYWDRYCEHYHACDRHVYFVRSTEYRDWHGEWRHPEWEHREDRWDEHEHHVDEHEHHEHHDEHWDDHDHHDHGHDDHDNHDHD
jgi:hypothetical protein